MPQLDFLIYSYQFTILVIFFFLFYDLILNYWLPAFLGSFFLGLRIRFQYEVLLSYLSFSQSFSFFSFVKKIKFLNNL